MPPASIASKEERLHPGIGTGSVCRIDATCALAHSGLKIAWK
jgi:hypothetical protein